jgi:hypothetical protein
MPRPFELDLAGMRKFMRNPELADALKRVVDSGAEFARSIAPEGVDESHNEPPGTYKNSIHGELIISHDRVEGRLIADDWKAALIEKGGLHGHAIAPAHHILSRSMDHMATTLSEA